MNVCYMKLSNVVVLVAPPFLDVPTADEVLRKRAGERRKIGEDGKRRYKAR